MLTLMYFILIIASIYFILISHPLLMGLLIMFSTLAITVSSGLFLSSFWLSYLIFIIYLGAMLILFAYISSMAPNEMVPPSSTLLTFTFFPCFTCPYKTTTKTPFLLQVKYYYNKNIF